MLLPMPNWSELPQELVSIISEKLYFYEDFLRFSVVCHRWRSALTFNYEQRRNHFLKSFPWLMLPVDDEDEDDHRFFFSPFENQIHRLSLPEARGCRCWGSPYGWLLTFGLDHQFHLLNPLSRIRLPLPPRSTFHEVNFTDSSPNFNRSYCVSKAIVLCADGDGDDVDQIVAYLIIGGYRQLAFARSGDKTWTVVKHSTLQQDVINFKGQIYTVKGKKVMICDQMSGPHPTLIKFVDFPDSVQHCDQYYLVELVGELHLVVRALDQTGIQVPPMELPHYKKTIYFEVYKLDLSTRKWDEQLQTLGDYAIFLGSNTSFALKASDYPECKPGCIYFTDDCDESYNNLVGGDMGIYNLETDTFESVYEGDDVLSRFSPPVWIMPKPF